MPDSTLNSVVEGFFTDIGCTLNELLPVSVKTIGQSRGFDRRLVLTRNDQKLDVFFHNGAIMVSNQIYIGGAIEAISFNADTPSKTIAMFVISRFARLE